MESGFTSINFGAVKEQETVPEGIYSFEVVSCRAQKTKAGNRNMIQAVLNITNPPKDILFPAPVIEFFVLPNQDDYRENRAMAEDWVRRLLRFLTCAGIPYNEEGFDVEEAQGATGTCGFALRMGDDDEIRNQAIWPKFKNK